MARARRIRYSLSNFASFGFSGWIADENAPGFHVFHRYRSCANDCSFADCHARSHECIRTNPGLGPNRNRRTKQGKIRLRVVVCSCANMSAMRNCYASSERHAAEVVDQRVLTNRAFISRLEIPREIDRCRWIYMNAATNPCSETAEQKSPPAEAGPRTEPKKRPREGPQHPADDVASWVFPGAAIFFNVQHAKHH